MHPHYQHQQSWRQKHSREWLDLWGVDRVWHREWTVRRGIQPDPNHSYDYELNGDLLQLKPKTSARHHINVWREATQQVSDAWFLDAITFIHGVEFEPTPEFSQHRWRVPVGKILGRPMRVVLMNYLRHSGADVDFTWEDRLTEMSEWPTIVQQYQRLNRRRFGLPALTDTAQTWPYRDNGLAWAENLSGGTEESWPPASVCVCMETYQHAIDVAPGVPVHFTTEKTFRALAHGLPTVFWADRHACRWLQSQGYRTWHEHWSEAYDDETSPEARLPRILAIIDQVNRWSNQEWLNRWPDFQQIHRHNRANYIKHHQRSRHNAEWLRDQL